MERPTFDISPIVVECRTYIGALDDFEVKVLGDIVVEGNTTTQWINSFSLKEHLIEFLFKCEEEAPKGKVSLIQYLRESGDLWGENLTNYNKWVEGQISGETLDWRIKQLKDWQERYTRFHEINYNLITLLRCKVMGLPLPYHLRLELNCRLPDGDTKVTQANVQPVDDAESQTVRNKGLTEKDSDQVPDSTGVGKTPILFIVKNAQNELFVSLSPYVEDEQHDSLTDLLSGKIVASPIIFNRKQVDLAYTFYQHMDSISAGAPVVSHWLYTYFKLNKAGVITKLSQSTIEKYLKGAGFSEKNLPKTKKN